MSGDNRTVAECLKDIEASTRRMCEVMGCTPTGETKVEGSLDSEYVETESYGEPIVAPKTVEMSYRHPVGFLKIPKDLDALEQFKFGGARFISPLTINNTDWNLRPKDQGSKPYCAGYAAASYIENILWRKTGIPDEVDADTIYKRAKEIDGDPQGSGTTLTAVLQAALDLGYFKEEKCTVKVLRTIEQVKRCIHRYGTCLIGVMVTREYYDCNKNKTAVCGEGDQTTLGGHAMQAVGFKKGGLIVRNSWGRDYGTDGDIIIAWKQLEQQFVYGATYDNPMVNFHI